MSEIFEIILAKPLEVLAGLGISSATIFAFIKFIAWLISLFTKKKKLKAEKEQQDAIADAVVNKIGGIEELIQNIASKVISDMISHQTFNEFKNYLVELKDKAVCPVELKAYIATMLTQEGCEKLSLIYESLKNEYSQNNKSKQIEPEKKQKVVEIEQNNAEIEQIELEKKQEDQNIEVAQMVDNVQPEDGDLDYA